MHMTMLEKHMVGMWCLVIKWNVKHYQQTPFYGKSKVIKIYVLLNFSSIYRWQTTTLADGSTEIRLIDLRYLKMIIIHLWQLHM